MTITAPPETTTVGHIIDDEILSLLAASRAELPRVLEAVA